MHLQPLRSLSDKITTCATKHLAIRKNLIRLADPNVIIKVDTSPKKPGSEKVHRPNYFQLRLYFSTPPVLHSCVFDIEKRMRNIWSFQVQRDICKGIFYVIHLQN